MLDWTGWIAPVFRDSRPHLEKKMTDQHNQELLKLRIRLLKSFVLITPVILKKMTTQCRSCTRSTYLYFVILRGEGLLLSGML